MFEFDKISASKIPVANISKTENFENIDSNLLFENSNCEDFSDNADFDLNIKVVHIDEATTEIYTKNENDEFVLNTRKIKTKNGYTADYYSKDGSTILKQKIFDIESNNLTVIKYDNSPDTNNSRTTIYSYDGAEENLNSIIVKDTVAGNTYETYYEVNRNDQSEILSLNQKVVMPDGKISYTCKYDGHRAIDALSALEKNEYYGGLQSEETFFDGDEQMIARTVREFSPAGALKSIAQYDENNELLILQNDFEMDDTVGTAYQGNTGDCYFLASINSLAQGEAGQKILRENVTVSTDENGEKIYEVNFPGAQIASDSLKTHLDKDKVYIKGAYVVTQKELDTANADEKSFSTGDQNVLLYELAFNKYRHDVKQTIEENNIDTDVLKRFNYSGVEGYNDPNAPIEGGYGSETQFLLTGKTPEQWYCRGEKRIGVEIDFYDRSANIKKHIKTKSSDNYDNYDNSGNLNTNYNTTKNTKYISLNNFMQTSKISTNKSAREKLFDKLIEDSKNDNLIDKNAVTAGIYVSYGDEKFGAHEIAILSMTKDTVTFLDSNDTMLGQDRQYTIPMKDFKKSLLSITVTSLE